MKKDPDPENSVDVNSGEVSERPAIWRVFFDGMIIELLIESGSWKRDSKNFARWSF
jgi:hypothetical protein